MKKLGLISLALVVALGALGTGYAMWYDTVTISGTVKTGSVDIEILTESYDEMYKNLETDELHYRHVVVNAGEPHPDPLGPPYVLIAWTNAVLVADDTLEISYNNIFPIPGDGWHGAGYWFTDFLLHNNGSVPVKLEVECVVDGIPEDLVVVITDSMVPFPPGEPLEGKQLHYCESLSCGIGVLVPQPPNNEGMGMEGTIRVTIKGIQWNEYAPPPTPTP